MGITVETAASKHPQARSLAYPVGYGVYYLLNNTSLGRAMTNLDENVVPAFRRALVNGKSQDGAWRKSRLTQETGAFPQCIQAGTE